MEKNKNDARNCRRNGNYTESTSIKENSGTNFTNQTITRLQNLAPNEKKSCLVIDGTTVILERLLTSVAEIQEIPDFVGSICRLLNPILLTFSYVWCAKRSGYLQQKLLMEKCIKSLLNLSRFVVKYHQNLVIKIKRRTIHACETSPMPVVGNNVYLKHMSLNQKGYTGNIRGF